MKHKLSHYWQLHNEVITLGLTVFFLMAGVIQYAFGLTYVLQLTPLVIGIITAVTVLYWRSPPKRKAFLVIGALSVGMLAEIIGVNSGILFGNYEYGSPLGIKLVGVPLLIGITWVLVTVAAWQMTSFSTFSKAASVFLAACIVVIFDLLLEQYATAFSLWSWQNGVIPLLNYVTWFGISLLLISLYAIYSKQDRPSLYGASVLPILAIYFWLMLLVR